MKPITAMGNATVATVSMTYSLYSALRGKAGEGAPGALKSRRSALAHYSHGKKFIGPASIRQKNSSLPNGSTVSDVKIYIKPNISQTPDPPLQLFEAVTFLFMKRLPKLKMSFLNFIPGAYQFGGFRFNNQS